jgi:uncharacterized protein (DUF2249 family)
LTAPARAPVMVDVREDLRQGRHPLGRILQAVKALAGGQDLLLLATFEPVPLYKVLALRGFDHEARRLAGGDWEVRFVRRRRGGRAGTAMPAASPPAAPHPTDRTQPAPSSGVAPAEGQARWTRLDNRGLDPPEPMMRTFAALGALADGEVLEIHNDRRPMFLYPHLEERGYRYQTLDQEDGSAFVRIWKPAAGSG